MTQLSHETKAQRKLFLRIQRKRLLWYNRDMPDSDYTLVIRPDPSPSSPEGVTYSMGKTVSNVIILVAWLLC